MIKTSKTKRTSPKPIVKQKQHVAEVTLLESFDLGKNTGISAGIKIKSSARGGNHNWARLRLVVDRLSGGQVEPGLDLSSLVGHSSRN